jgi:hypothetical protein
MRSYVQIKYLLRKPLLYPAELRDRPAFLVATRTPRQSASRARQCIRATPAVRIRPYNVSR